MPTLRFVALLLCALWSTGCAATDGCRDPQAVVDELAAANPDIVRLSLHCRQDDGTIRCCASTDSARVGRPSGEENAHAMEHGKAVVMDEGAHVDVTVPAIERDGRWTTVAGITLRGHDREAATARARQLAAAIGAALGDRCPSR